MFEDAFLTVFLTVMAVIMVIATIGLFLLKKDTRRIKEEISRHKLLQNKSA